MSLSGSRSVDANLTVDAAPVHPARHVDGFGAADQHLVRVAAAERAGAPEGTRIDHGHRPPGFPHAEAGDLSSRAGTDDDEIVLLCHWPADFGRSVWRS